MHTLRPGSRACFRTSFRHIATTEAHDEFSCPAILGFMSMAITEPNGSMIRLHH